MRSADIKRKTNETDITLSLSLDGEGRGEIDSGCGFLDHMLTLFTAHGRFNLSLVCRGDVNVDYHHTAEDIAICLGEAFKKALGNKEGICRYGSVTLPMDEALILSAVDISGRSYLAYSLDFKAKKIGDFDTELVEEFWQAFVRSSGVTLHITKLAGRNSHHVAEGAFKSVARSIRQAVAIDPTLRGEIPSTKGVI